MKNKLSPSCFYLSNTILYNCLLAFPLSAAIEQVNQTESCQPSNTLIIDSVNKRLEIDETKSIDQESSPKLTKDEQITRLINEVKTKDKQLDEKKDHIQMLNQEINKKDKQLKEREQIITELQNILQNIPIEAKGKNQQTPFLCAVKKGQLSMAKLLRKWGANIHAKNEYGNSALHLACLWSDSVDMITWLLDDCKIGIETKGYAQKTPFLYAAQEGKLAIAKLLKKRGANINAKDRDGKNALHYACLFSRSAPMTTWLLNECKIGIATKGYAQKTPFLYAAQGGQQEVAKLLERAGR